VPNTVRGPTLRAVRRPATRVAAVARAREFRPNTTVRRPREHAGLRNHPPRSHFPGHRAHFALGSGWPQPLGVLKDHVERNLLQISAALLFVGAAGWCCLIYNQFQSPVLVTPAAAYTVAAKADADVEKTEPFSTSRHARVDHALPFSAMGNNLGDTESAASLVAREWSLFNTLRAADRGGVPTKQSLLKPRVHLASLESAPRSNPAFHAPNQAVPLHIRPAAGAETMLVDFETAPFPYHGMIGGSNRPFLNVGEEGHRGHANFRGHVFWESETFSDDRVLLHIPPGFDPALPAVMVVFFHGHGANLARDVRDRQLVPAQITAAGVNAVLVAPQFAVDAPDSSAGKFWEPNGFKRFLDEAALKLARLYGDPRRAAAFAKMPIVIVAYSGGFGPTLSVLDQGGVRSRVRGIVLLDALYAGIDKFADWIANNRSTFFVSSYTPHTAHHNADLEHLLSTRSVPYGGELRSSHLQGMVAFLPAGDVSHQDFVTHAWANNPIADILERMDNIDQKIETAGTTASISSSASAAMRN
jgi:hypothetical protein